MGLTMIPEGKNVISPMSTINTLSSTLTSPNANKRISRVMGMKRLTTAEFRNQQELIQMAQTPAHIRRGSILMLQQN